MANYSHVGYSLTVGYVHSARFYGHSDYRGVAHALVGGPERPYEGADYRTLCGKTIRTGDDGHKLTVSIAPDQAGTGVSCSRCLATLRPKAKRCPHDWEPLIHLPESMTADQRLKIGYSVALSRLGDYDRCKLCGRLSRVGRRRKLVSNDWLVERVNKQAADLQAWIGKEMERTNG